MQFDLRAENAQLLDRDDIRASVTGDLAIRSDGRGGTISGDVTVTEGRFRLGSATAAAEVPRLNVREVNRIDADFAPVVRRIEPWIIAMSARPGYLKTLGGFKFRSEHHLCSGSRRGGCRGNDGS